MTLPNQFDQLLEWLSEDTIDRLQEEPSPAYRVSLFGFPAQMARLKPVVFNFLNADFRADPLPRQRHDARLLLHLGDPARHADRPVDRIARPDLWCGACRSSTGYSGTGKSFFLTDLISKVIIGEADWVSTDRAAIRRALILKAISVHIDWA